MLLNHALSIATEDLETITENEGSYESMEFIDSYFDMVNSFENIDTAFDNLSELEVAYEEFNNTAEFISENGITKQLAMFIDNENQIISKEDFEELSDIPEKSVALEGKISDWANKVWDMIVKAYNAVIAFFAKMFQSVYRFFTNAEKKLNAIIEKLKDKSDADLNKEKIKKAEVKCYEKESSLLVDVFKNDVSTTFEKLLGIAEDLKKILESSKDVSEDDAATFIQTAQGKMKLVDTEVNHLAKATSTKLTFTYSDGTSKIGTSFVVYSIGESTFKNIKKKSVMDAVESVDKYVAYIKVFVKTYKSSNDEYKKIEKKFSEFSKDMAKYAKTASKSIKEKDEKFKTYFVKQIKSYSTMIQTLLTKYIKLQQNHAYMLISAGSSVISCLDKEEK